MLDLARRPDGGVAAAVRTGSEEPEGVHRADGPEAQQTAAAPTSPGALGAPRQARTLPPRRVEGHALCRKKEQDKRRGGERREEEGGRREGVEPRRSGIRGR